MKEEKETGARLKIGSRVIPRKPDKEPTGYLPGFRKRCRWDVPGVIVGRSDAHGVTYEVAHDAGGIAWYEPSELELETPEPAVTRLPDGSVCAQLSLPLPKTHWLYADHENVPPAPFRIGTATPKRWDLAMQVEEAARYAIRAATLNGKTQDFDPDALVQNMIIGLLGPWTADGKSKL